MDKSEIMAAAEWLAEKNRLDDLLRTHAQTCKHWSLGHPYMVERNDPQFPPYKRAQCEFCGREVDAR